MNNDLSLDLYLWSLKLHRGHLSFLRYFYEDTQVFLPGKHKFLNELNTLGLIFENEITSKGRSLYEECLSWSGEYVPQSKPVKVERTYSEEFLTWWKLFPSNDTFEVDGKSFQGLRNFKTKKDECQTKFDFLTTIISAQELIDALQFEVDARIDQSLIRGANQLTYLQNTWTYLHNKSFEPYLALAAKGPYKRRAEQKKELIDTTKLF